MTKIKNLTILTTSILNTDDWNMTYVNNLTKSGTGLINNWSPLTSGSYNGQTKLTSDSDAKSKR